MTHEVETEAPYWADVARWLVARGAGDGFAWDIADWDALVAPRLTRLLRWRR